MKSVFYPTIQQLNNPDFFKEFNCIATGNCGQDCADHNPIRVRSWHKAQYGKSGVPEVDMMSHI